MCESDCVNGATSCYWTGGSWIRYELTRLVQDNLSVPIDILANYVASVTLNMVIWWLENGMPYPPEKMADTSSRLVMNGLHGVLRTIGTTIG